MLRQSIVSAVSLSLLLSACGPADTAQDITLLEGTFPEFGGHGFSAKNSKPAGWTASDESLWNASLLPVPHYPTLAGVYLAPRQGDTRPVTLQLEKTLEANASTTYHLKLQARPRADNAGARAVMLVDWLAPGCQSVLETTTLESTAKASAPSGDLAYTVQDVQSPAGTGCARIEVMLEAGNSGVTVYEASIQRPR